MSILYKYIAKQILKYFGIVMAFVIGIYVAVDFIERVDDFIEASQPFSKMMLFFALKISSIKFSLA